MVARSLFVVLIAFFTLQGVTLFSGTALAHPHVWVSAKSTLLYNDSGFPEAVRHVWSFDEAFSAFAVDGLDINKDGVYSREELQDLAKTNVTSLAEFGFFTFGLQKDQEFGAENPKDYWLEHDGKALTLHFTLAFSKGIMRDRAPFSLDVYDPTYFVAFSWADKSPITLENAPSSCTAVIEKRSENRSLPAEAISEDFFDNLQSDMNFGAQFANTVFLGCSAEELKQAKMDILAYRKQQTAKNETVPEPSAAALDSDRIPQEKITERLPSEVQSAQKNDGVSGQRSCQMGAFGIIRPDGVVGSQAGFLGWISAQQARFYKVLSGIIGRNNEFFSWFFLIGVGFLYGVFHAAGPGHGKAVISSYLIATGETLRRGILLSFISAFIQACVAVGIVSGVTLLLNAGSKGMGVAAFWMESLSYGAIAVLGAWLVLRTFERMKQVYTQTATHNHSHVHGSHHHDAHCGCGHSHGVEIAALQSEHFSWKRAAIALLAVGLRPCTGAILILVLAFSQGLYGAGIAAAFAMALGTAITVSVIAALAVYAKNLARYLSHKSQNGKLYIHLFELFAGGVVFIVGVLFLLALLANGLLVNC